MAAVHLYPEINPYNIGRLKVDHVHELYYEQSGKQNGKPVLFLHGGPGSGVNQHDRRFFDPNIYRIVMFDQRGAGKSTPAAELKDNTTWHLVADIEKIRKHLDIGKWVVFGGSWGSTLALAYAQTHPDNVKALILRGIFTLRRKEVLWFYQDGASHLFPDYWEVFINQIPEAERHDLLSAYYKRLTGDDEKVKQICAKSWSAWECATSKLVVDQENIARAAVCSWALQFARIECHYFIHGGWFKYDDQLIKEVEKIRHIPATIVQGRYDVVCPARTAWQLHKNWPEAEFHIVPNAGHASREIDTAKLLVEAADKYKSL
uniref:Proline iminopeptidase n=1 Tax=Saccoglossus kowalevskii TaxID=10224 RepID=A0ABM0H0N1_SACKO|nr:PREDICTED: proline iminopeptidase-like [Saccoglossus kowalevskii]